jgi:copper chaperone CopZ
MIKYILISVLISLTTTYQNSNAKANFRVDGVCMMCKSRIETTTIKLKGVKVSKWDMNTNQISLIYNEKKIKLNDIHKSIAEIGHDTEKVTATDKAYNSLAPCCKYRDPMVVKNHQ